MAMRVCVRIGVGGMAAGKGRGSRAQTVDFPYTIVRNGGKKKLVRGNHTSKPVHDCGLGK